MIELCNDCYIDADKYEWRIIHACGTYIDKKSGEERPRYEVLGHYVSVEQAAISAVNILLRRDVASEGITDLKDLCRTSREYRQKIWEKLK